MQKTISFLLIVMAATQTACSLKKANLAKVWFYTYSKNVSEDYLDISPASFLNLEPGGSYTRDFGTFDYGRWEQKNKTLQLTTTSGKTFLFPAKLLKASELRLETPKETLLNFEGQPSSFSSPAANPFSLENNQWRIPVAKKETEQEIKKRLLDHCRFYELYFRWALYNGISQIDVRSTPSLIKIYGNGFALKSFEELPATWRSYFFDEEDCRKANAIIKDIFEHSDIAWSNSDNKFKMFISAFQQLQQLLK